MSISSINSSYSAYTYQWQSQQLQSASTNTSSSNTSANSTYTYEGSSTVSSMIELVQFAMDAMGVSGNERVTFSQVETYKNEIEKEFSDELNARIASTGIDPKAEFTVTLDNNGKIFVTSEHTDKTKIQNYFDSNPQIGTDLLNNMQEKGMDVNGFIKFNVSGAGSISLISSDQNQIDVQEAFSDNALLGSDLLKSLEDEEILFNAGLKLNYSEGKLSVDEDDPNAESLQTYLDAHPELVDEIKATLQENGLSETTELSLDIDNTGKISTDMALANADENIEDFLIQSGIGQDIKTGLKSQGIDPDVDFRLSVQDGKVVVNSSHPDAAYVQALLDSDEELSKAYLQINALAGIDAARQAMQVDVGALKSRIEMESMAVWWAQTDTSSFSSYADSSMTSMTGINSVV